MEIKEGTRYPNLGTVLMVEEFLRENSYDIFKFSELRRKLPKQVMHQTLKIIVEYLEESGKVIVGTKGIQWIYCEDLDKLKENSVEFKSGVLKSLS